MKLIALTPCQDTDKTNPDGSPVVYQTGTEFEANDKAGKEFLEMNAAVKPDDKKAASLLANARAIATVNEDIASKVEIINENNTVTTPGSIA